MHMVKNVYCILLKIDTEDPRYNDSICPQRFCRYREFAARKNLNMYQYDKW